MRSFKIFLVLFFGISLAACAGPNAGPNASFGSLAGGVLGGLAGNTIGGGKGNVLATALGTVFGIVAGHEAGRAVDVTRPQQNGAYGVAPPSGQSVQPPWRCSESYSSYGGTNRNCHRETYRATPWGPYN